MNKSFFDDLDKIIESSVNSVIKSEKEKQNFISREVERLGIDASKNKKKKKDKDMEEAEGDDSEEEKTSDAAEEKPQASPDAPPSAAKKITGAPPPEAFERPTDAPGTRTSGKLADLPMAKLRNPKPDEVAKKINVLRGGGSLNNKKIAKSVDEYLRSLTSAENASLVTFLTNLSQIMAPIKDPDEVRKPKDVGIETMFSDSFEKNKDKEAEKKKSPEPKSEKKPEKKAEPEKKKEKPKSGGEGIVVVGGD